MSVGTIYPNLDISESLRFKKMTLAFLVLGFVLSLSLLSTSARAIIGFTATINSTPAVAPLTAINLTFTLFNVSAFPATLTNVTNVTISFQNASVGSSGLQTGQFPGTLINVTPAGSNSSLTSTSTSFNASTIVFSNTSTSGLFNNANQVITFSVNVSAPASGNYTIFVNTTVNGTTTNSVTADNSTTFALQVVNGTVTLTNGTFVNTSYAGTGVTFPMNFTAAFSAGTGNGSNNNTNVTVKLYLNSTNGTSSLIVTNWTNTTLGAGGNWITALSFNDTEYTPNTYVYVLNTTGCGNSNPSVCGNATNYSSASFTTVLNITPGTLTLFTQINNSYANASVTYPNSQLNFSALTPQLGLLPTINLYINQSGSSISVNSSANNVTSIGFTVGAGTWSVIANNTANANWTVANNNTFYQVVVNGTPNVVTYLNNATANYTLSYPNTIEIRGNSTTTVTPPTFNLYATNINITANVTLGSGNPSASSIVLGAGLNQIVYNTSGNANWTTAQNTSLYLIIQNGTVNSLVAINGTPGNQTLTYPSSMANITANSTSGNNPPTINFYYVLLNTGGGTLVGSGNQSTTFTFPAGTHRLIQNSTGNANYSSLNNNTIFLIVNNGTSIVNVFTNGTSANISTTYPNSVVNVSANTTSTLTPPTFTLYWVNSTGSSTGGVSLGTGNASSTFTFPNGTYDIIYNTTGNANWTSASNSSIYVNVTPGATGLTITVTPSLAVSPNTATTATFGGCPSAGSADISCSWTRTWGSGSTTASSSATDTQTFSPATTQTYTYSTGGGANWTGASATAIITVSQASSSGGTSGGGGGGAGGGTTTTTPPATVTTGQVAISLPSVVPGTTAVTTVSNSDTGITEIDLNVNNAVSSAALTVNKVTPAQLPSAPTGTLYQSLSISKSGMQDADVSSSTIKFSVTKAWLTANNIDQTTVKLQRYVNGAWTALPTTVTSSDSNNVYYAAVTPGFSYFTVTGQQATTPSAPSTPTTPSAPSTPTTPSAPSNTWLIIGVVVLIVLVAAWYYWSKSKKR